MPCFVVDAFYDCDCSVLISCECNIFFTVQRDDVCATLDHFFNSIASVVFTIRHMGRKTLLRQNL